VRRSVVRRAGARRVLPHADTGRLAGGVSGGSTMPAKKSTGGRKSWGAPRKTQHQSGATAAFARAVAGALPGVRATNRSGRTSYAVEGKRFVVVADDVAVVTAADGERDLALLQVGRDELRSAIEDGWKEVAPKRAVTAFEKQQRARDELPE